MQLRNQKLFFTVPILGYISQDFNLHVASGGPPPPTTSCILSNMDVSGLVWAPDF